MSSILVQMDASWEDYQIEKVLKENKGSILIELEEAHEDLRFTFF